MTAPTRGSTTGPSQIEVNWIALAASDNGGSTVLSYNLLWDAGTSGTTWTSVIGYSPVSTAVTTTISTGIVSGSSYQFKVRASNIFGWGSNSTITTIKAAKVPAQMTAPTTSIDSTTGGVKISWTAPDSQGDTITAYKIEI